MGENHLDIRGNLWGGGGGGPSWERVQFIFRLFIVMYTKLPTILKT